MIFQMTEEQRLATQELRKFLDRVIEPEFLEHGEKSIPKEKMSRWVNQLVEFGLINAPHPECYGGLGLNWVMHLLLSEEVAVSSLDIALPILVNAVGADLLNQIASEAIKQQYLPRLLEGDFFICLGVSEPDAGSDLTAIKCQAVRDGDDWIINGEKTWITNGQYSDILICTCKTDDNAFTHILIDRAEHGYEVLDIDKVALNGQSTARIILSDVRVPVSNTIGPIGAGLKNTLVTFERARCHMAVGGYALARRAMEEAVGYSQTRSQHGKFIAGHQMVAEKLSIMATEIDAARLLTLRAGAMIDQGQRCDTECAMAKWFATEVGVRATRDALQIHGGNGVTKEFIVERLVREAIMGPIPDGTTEVQKLLIARNLTGISAFH